jgi:hypothetical protein
MRWTPVVLLLIAIAIAVIVARGLPDEVFTGNTGPQPETPVNDAVRAASPTGKPN